MHRRLFCFCSITNIGKSLNHQKSIFTPLSRKKIRIRKLEFFSLYVMYETCEIVDFKYFYFKHCMVTIIYYYLLVTIILTNFCKFLIYLWIEKVWICCRCCCTRCCSWCRHSCCCWCWRFCAEYLNKIVLFNFITLLKNATIMWE